MKQMTFADAEYAGKRKQTRKELFLIEMDRVRSMNPTYHMMGQQVTVASLASSSTAEELRSRPPTMHTAGA
ncbi:hypothetical protein, partial [Pseudomonas monteilii]|uniref:hypothetical protein n=1 Tax=Pseudomonas monteilii TaxID=76759 RepID=UPI0015FC29FD